jgi:tetratricopeptide (TPR) repeat protein
MAKVLKQSISEDLYSEAQQLLSRGEFSAAINKLRTALKTRQNPGGWGILAWSLLEQGDHKESLIAAKKMRNLALKIPSRPLVAIADCLMGLIHDEAGRKVLAERYYRESLDAHPRPETCIFLGVLLNQQGKSIEAKIHYQRALQLDPEFLEARYNLARWYYTHRDFDRTVDHLRMILHKNPKYPDAVELLTIALWQFGPRGFQQAAEALEESLVHDITNVRKHILLALSYRLMNKYKEAEQTFLFVINQLEENSAAHLLYANMLAEKVRKHSLAEKHFRKALEIAPNKGANHYYYAKFLISNNCIPEARSHLEKAIQLGYEKAELLLANLPEAE